MKKLFISLLAVSLLMGSCPSSFAGEPGDGGMFTHMLNGLLGGGQTRKAEPAKKAASTKKVSGCKISSPCSKN